ncbi:hypothetical protein ACQ4PT_020809 [Festuca glaucescens]
MTRRCGISSAPPLAALALLLLVCFSHCAAAAARLFPASTAPHLDTGIINVKSADAASDGLAVLPAEGSKVGNGEEAAPEVTRAAAEEACEEGTDGEECMQRRLLHDAHLDYIYTQRKGKP